jgi:putative sporulation protein YyaC
VWPSCSGNLIPARQFNRVHVNQESAPLLLSRSLYEHMSLISTPGTSPIIVCIGTDRSTGDALGPLIGTSLQQTFRDTSITVYGTLDEPVHAANLAEVLDAISEQVDQRPVIAIDACLGKTENVGYINVKPGALKPGTGVNKRLPSVGDVHIVGIVNVGGFMEYFVLQNTRLSLVMSMANIISAAVENCLCELWLSQVAATTYLQPCLD